MHEQELGFSAHHLLLRMNMLPRPKTVEEARLFVGTVLERRFSTKAYFGWYTATISEVGRSARERGAPLYGLTRLTDNKAGAGGRSGGGGGGGGLQQRNNACALPPCCRSTLGASCN